MVVSVQFQAVPRPSCSLTFRFVLISVQALRCSLRPSEINSRDRRPAGHIQPIARFHESSPTHLFDPVRAPYPRGTANNSHARPARP